MKRIGAIAVAISLTAGVFFNVPARAAASQTLTVWSTGGDADAAVMAVAGKLFEKANPGVKVVVNPISWDDGYAKVLAAAAAKSGPDIFTGGLSWGISAGNKGALADLRALNVVNTVQPKVDRKSTRLNSSHIPLSRMPSSA